MVGFFTDLAAKKKEIKKPKELMRQRHTRLLAHKDTHSKRAVKHTHTHALPLVVSHVRSDTGPF